MRNESRTATTTDLCHRALLTERERPRLRFWKTEAGSCSLQEEDGSLHILVRIIAHIYPEFYTKYEEISFYPLCCVDRLLLYGGQVSEVAGRCDQRGPRRSSCTH